MPKIKTNNISHSNRRNVAGKNASTGQQIFWHNGNGSCLLLWSGKGVHIMSECWQIIEFKCKHNSWYWIHTGIYLNLKLSIAKNMKTNKNKNALFYVFSTLILFTLLSIIANRIYYQQKPQINGFVWQFYKKIYCWKQWRIAIRQLFHSLWLEFEL